MTKKTKPKRKWLLPATCEMCKRTCTEFWGEVADMWSCEGHYQIMQANRTSWELKHLPTHTELWKMVEDEGYDTKNLTDKDRDEIKATPEWEAAMTDSTYLRYKELRKKGIAWLKVNPEPEEAPTCGQCDELARAHDKEEFYCMDHWPLKEAEDE